MKKNRHTINVLLIIFISFLTCGSIVGTYWFTLDATLKIQNYICIVLTFGTFVTLFINQNLFNLMLGITLIIGNFGGLSIFNETTTLYLGFNIGPIPIPLYYGQPEFSALLLIYLIFNKEFYIGIMTKEYWDGFLYRTKDLEQVFTIVNADTEKAGNEKSDEV